MQAAAMDAGSRSILPVLEVLVGWLPYGLLQDDVGGLPGLGCAGGGEGHNWGRAAVVAHSLNLRPHILTLAP